MKKRGRKSVCRYFSSCYDLFVMSASSMILNLSTLHFVVEDLQLHLFFLMRCIIVAAAGAAATASFGGGGGVAAAVAAAAAAAAM